MTDETVTKSSAKTTGIQLNNALGRRKSDLSEITGVGSTELIQFAGKQGLFVPLTDQDFPEESESNLQQLLLSMKQQMSQLQMENLRLKNLLEEAQKKSHRTPDDFATAVTHSIDSLQTRLNETKNPVSRFAIKEFNIDMRVYAEVTPMGTLDYRFIPPDETVDTNRLTNLKMTVVPLPKDDLAGSWTSPDFTPMVDIEEIQGIGESYQKLLNNNNIYTISDLLTAGTRVRSKVELASMLEVDHNRLSNWLAQAELMTIRSIDGRAAEILADIGITGLQQLAQQESEALVERYNKQVSKLGHASVKPQTQESISQWITTAATYVGVTRPGVLQGTKVTAATAKTE